jgi:hypothetical protein
MKTLPIMLISITILFTACKKPKDGEQGPQGPQGQQGPAGVVTTSSNGFIKGTLSGTRSDGTAFNSVYNYTNYWGGPSATVDSSSSHYEFSIGRGTDILSVDVASFNIVLPNFASSSATVYINNFAYSQSLGTNRLFQFFVYNNVTLAGTVIGFSYNPTTGLIKGNYSISISGTNNSTGNPATINGSFEGTATKIYYRSSSVKLDVIGDKKD